MVFENCGNCIAMEQSGYIIYIVSKIIEKKFSQQNKVLGNIEKFAENQGLQTFFFKEKVS